VAVHPILTGVVFEDEGFDAQFVRVLDTIPYGGADFGEALITARLIPSGDRDAFRRASELVDHPIEPVRIPYDGTALDAYFAPPPVTDRSRRWCWSMGTTAPWRRCTSPA
jgi:hypothetical protein